MNEANKHQNDYKQRRETLFLLINYVRIRFKTMDVRYVIKKILMIKVQYMAQDARSAYTYTSRFYHRDIVMCTSSDESKGVLLKLREKAILK